MSKFTVDLHPLKERLLEALRPVLAKQEEAWKAIEAGSKHPEWAQLKRLRPEDFDVPALRELVMLLEDADPYLLTMTFGIDEEEGADAPVIELQALNLVEGGGRG